LEEQHSNGHMTRAIEISIRLIILACLIFWSYEILSPFISLFIWGLIIAITEYPLYKRLKKILRGRGKLAATLITLLFLLILLVPALLLADSLLEGINHVRAIYQSGQLAIPPPDDRVKSWPAFTKPLVDLWQLSSENLAEVSMKYVEEIKRAGLFLFKLIAGTSVGVLQFVVSIILAGVFITYAEEGGSVIRKVFVKLDERQGAEFADIAEVTIRNVMKGVLGVAILQTLLAGIGYVVVGIPAAGFWIFMSLILAVIQVGVGPVAIGAAIYVFATEDTLTSVLFGLWTVFVALSDNILKPILLGRGAPVPMLVVFLGSIGGFVFHGFIGLFLGAVILSLAYKMFLRWIETTSVKLDQEEKTRK
jgi:predicted PurR-regulated permease PerM